jgi:hypothetical protein
MSLDNLAQRMAEDKQKAQKRSEPSFDFVGGFLFIALAIRATDCAALGNCYDAVIAPARKFPTAQALHSHERCVHNQRTNGTVQSSKYRKQRPGLSRKTWRSSATEAAHDERRFRPVNNERGRLLANVLNVYAARRECRYPRGASKARFPS